MPRQATSTRTTKSSPANSRTTSSRQPSGNGRRTAPKQAYWGVELVASTETALTLEGANGQDFGLAVCSTCATILPGSDTAMKIHSNWHEQVNGIDQRASR